MSSRPGWHSKQDQSQYPTPCEARASLVATAGKYHAGRNGPVQTMKAPFAPQASSRAFEADFDPSVIKFEYSFGNCSGINYNGSNVPPIRLIWLQLTIECN